MIHEAIVIMTVLGCGDHEIDCHIIPGPKASWTSEAQCDAAIPEILGQLNNAPYPLLTAKCETTHATVDNRSGNIGGTDDSSASFDDNQNENGGIDNEPNMFEIIRARSQSTDFGILSGTEAAIDYIAGTPAYITGKVYDLVTWD